MNTQRRDVSKFLEEFQSIISKSNTNSVDIYVSELNQLYGTGKKDTLDLMGDSYKFGFIAGLHYAEKQRKK